MQIKFWNFRLYGLNYTNFVNLSPSKEKKSSKICIIPIFVVILQRETMDNSHSSAGMCIFCRMGGGYEGGEESGEDAERGKGKQAYEAGEDAEQGFVVLLPNGKMGR